MLVRRAFSSYSGAVSGARRLRGGPDPEALLTTTSCEAAEGDGIRSRRMRRFSTTGSQIERPGSVYLVGIVQQSGLDLGLCRSNVGEGRRWARRGLGADSQLSVRQGIRNQRMPASIATKVQRSISRRDLGRI